MSGHAIARSLVIGLDMCRLCHDPGLLHATRLPILDALEVGAEVREEVICGSGLVDARGTPGVVSPLALRMPGIREATGEIDAAVERGAHFCDLGCRP